MAEWGISQKIPSSRFSLILDSKDAVRSFKEKTHNWFGKEDVAEIITQISFVLLNAEDEHLAELDNLPEVNRMYNQSFLEDYAAYQMIKEEVARLAHAIHALIKNLGVYEINRRGQKEFPYFFHQLLGDDIVLDKFDPETY